VCQHQRHSCHLSIDHGSRAMLRITKPSWNRESEVALAKHATQRKGCDSAFHRLVMKAKRSAVRLILLCVLICFCWGSLQSMQVLSRLVPSFQSKSVSATTTRKLAVAVPQKYGMGRGSLRKIDQSKQPNYFAIHANSQRKKSARPALHCCVCLVLF